MEHMAVIWRLEVRAALQTYGNHDIKVIDRVYGLGGKDFYADDAEQFFQLAIDAVETDKVEVPFDYYGHTPGNPELAPKRRVEPMKKEDLIQVLLRLLLMKKQANSKLRFLH